MVFGHISLTAVDSVQNDLLFLGPLTPETLIQRLAAKTCFDIFVGATPLGEDLLAILSTPSLARKCRLP